MKNLKVKVIITLIVSGLIYFLWNIDLPECAFAPIDQNIILDTLETDGVNYTLVHSGGGSWQDKVYYFKIYPGPVTFDECGRESIQPLYWIHDDYESSKCNKSIILKKNKIEIIYAIEGEQCTLYWNEISTLKLLMQ